MSADKIATLTADAIRASGDKTIADIRERLELAEQMATDLRAEGEAFIAVIGANTLALTDRIAAYVTFCQQTTLMFGAAHAHVDTITKPNGAETTL